MRYAITLMLLDGADAAVAHCDVSRLRRHVSPLSMPLIDAACQPPLPLFRLFRRRFACLLLRQPCCFDAVYGCQYFATLISLLLSAIASMLYAAIAAAAAVIDCRRRYADAAPRY